MRVVCCATENNAGGYNWKPRALLLQPAVRGHQGTPRVHPRFSQVEANRISCTRLTENAAESQPGAPDRTPRALLHQPAAVRGCTGSSPGFPKWMRIAWRVAGGCFLPPRYSAMTSVCLQQQQQQEAVRVQQHHTKNSYTCVIIPARGYIHRKNKQNGGKKGKRIER
ncbi:unnamed protein product [Laminaria digitata]